MKSPKQFRRYSVPAFFHFTDRRNLPLIVEHGGLYSLVELKRKNIKVPAPGGNQWSHDADEMNDVDQYIHLCFRANHPMEFLAREEGRIQDSIFLQIHPSILDVDDVMFSPGVSNKSGMPIYPIGEAVKKNRIDFEILYTRTDWSDRQINDRLQAAEKSELLVPRRIPIKYIRNLPNG